MAASQVGRPMHYYTFQEPGLSDSFKELHSLLKEKKVTVGMFYLSFPFFLSYVSSTPFLILAGDLWNLLMEVSQEVFPPEEEEKASQKKEGPSQEERRLASSAGSPVPQLFNFLFERYDE